MKKSQIAKMKKLAKSRSIPVIDGHVLIQDGWATATNLEIAVRYRTEVKGTGVVPIMAIEDFDSAEIIGESIFAKKGSTELTYPAYPAKDFPFYDAADKELKAVNFKHVAQFKDVAKLAGNDDMRPAMSGVYFDDNNLVATDAHKLRWYKYPNKGENFIVPSAVADLMLENEYRMSLVQNKYQKTERIIFRGNDEIIISRLIVDQRYPNWMAVLPERNELTLKLKVPTETLVTALKAGLKTSVKCTKSVIFHVKGSTLDLFAFDFDLKKEFKTSIQLDREHGEIQFCYNAELMLSILNTKMKYTNIELERPNRACIINGDTLLMPVKIHDEITEAYPHIVASTEKYKPIEGEDYPGIYKKPTAETPTAQTPISQTSNAEPQTPNAETPNAETVPLSEAEVPNAEPQTPNAEPQTPNAETSNAETVPLSEAEVPNAQTPNVHTERSRSDEPQSESPIQDENKTLENSPETEVPNEEEALQQLLAGQVIMLDYYKEAGQTNSFVVFGDTKVFREQFRENYGKWIPFDRAKGFIVVNEREIPLKTIAPLSKGGWFFGHRRREAIEQIIS